MAAVALSVAFALAGREPARPASRSGPETRASEARTAAARAAHAVDCVHALVLRERARAEPNPRVQSEPWEQAGLAFDEIAAQRDIDAATWKRAARAAVVRSGGETLGAGQREARADARSFPRRRTDRRRQRRCCSTSAWYVGGSSHRSR
jgi:hypothetical protein